jgi:hypothetical protein
MERAVAARRAGDLDEVRRLATQALLADPRNEHVIAFYNAVSVDLSRTHAAAEPPAPVWEGPTPRHFLPAAGAIFLGVPALYVYRRRRAYGQQSEDAEDAAFRSPENERYVEWGFAALVAATLVYGAWGYIAASHGTRMVAGMSAAPVNHFVGRKMEPGETFRMLRAGEYLNRVWDSRHGVLPGASGPQGMSFCQGNCLPINAASAIQTRGLGIPEVVNDARRGAAFRLSQDLIVIVRQAKEGSVREIMVHQNDYHTLRLIEVSKLP